MHKIWERYRGYNFVHALSNLVTRSCFRSIRIEGTERLPREGAVILAPNHCATLMDPMVALMLSRDPIAYGARSDVFKNPKVAKILRWLRIVPIARERNGLQEVAKNFDVFEEIVDCLGHDIPFCLYAEGAHRPERGMMPVKKGIFRIAKMASEELGRPVQIFPVGVDYEYFFRGQGRLTARIGEPLEITRAFAEHPEGPEAKVYRELCQTLQERILSLIGRLPERRHDRKALRLLGALLSLPLFAVCAAGSLVIWLPYLLILRKIQDKAWSHTVRYVLHLVLLPFVPFHIGFERLLNFYCNLVEDLK